MSHFDAFFEEMLERDMRFCDELLNPYLQVHNELTDFFAKEAEIEQRCKRNNQVYVPNLEEYEELTERYEEAMESTSTVVDKFELNINNNKENIPGTSGATTETPLPVATTAAGSSRPKRAAFLDASKTINKQVNLTLKEKLRREDVAAEATNKREIINDATTAASSSRPKRAAFLDASKTINKQVNLKLTEKLRREDVAAEATNKRTTIKTEKLSTTSKSDDDVAMPPPQSFPMKVRPNRRIKKERLEISVIPEDEESDCVVEVKKEHSKSSDIVLQEARVSLVDLTLAGSSQNNCFIGESSRDTYVLQNTTTIKQSTDKRTREDDNSVESNKRSKTNTPPINENLNGSGRTQYDDAEQQQQKPIYLRMKTPRLPTNDCYDSDGENYHKSKPQLSDWAQSAHLEDAQFTMAFCGEKIKNTFFSRCAQTVDLQDVFQTNNPKLLKRTSSAHWTVPPKYSILPKTLEISDEVFEEEEEE